MAMLFCSLASGSSGNCQYIATENVGLLLDAGLSGKYITSSLEHINADISKLKAVLITHEHSDHIKGVGILMRKYDLELYITDLTFTQIEKKLGKINLEKVHIIEKDIDFYIGDILVHPFPVSHDAVDTIAFSFSKGDTKISVVTDLGFVPIDLLAKICDSNLLMIESNHDVEMLNAGKYPYSLKRRILSDKGHISNVTAADAIIRAMQSSKCLGHIILAHLSKDNNTPEVAYETVKSIVEENGIEVGTEISLDLAYRDRVGKLYKLE